MMPTSVIGVDIGGANLKAASSRGQSSSRFFPLWKDPSGLSGALDRLITPLIDPACSDVSLAVTMTGELADCFVDRQVGVRHIVDAMMDSAERLRVHAVRFYGVDGNFHAADRAKHHPDSIAASNWHGLASFIATHIAANGWLIDTGSTTCDLLRLSDGKLDTDSRTDFDRLAAGELVYIGCRRTPVSTLVDRLTVKLSGRRPTDVPVMNELFATTDDVGLVLGRVDERSEDMDSADGNPRTVTAAVNRLARMVGLDHRQVDLDTAQDFARQILGEVGARITRAVDRLRLRESTLLQSDPSRKRPQTLILSGHGGWILPADLGDQFAESGDRLDVIRLADSIGEDLDRCAPAYAMAKLFAP